MSAVLPSASTRLSDESGGMATGTDLLAVFAPVPDNDDEVPRFYSSAQSIYATHGYSPGLSYCAHHFELTGKPLIFVPCTIETAGVVGRKDDSGNTGTSAVDVSVGSDGSLEEVDGSLTVVAGGTIGTDQILLSLSLDGGRTSKPVRLGKGNSYTIPYVGQALSFGAGTLVTGDTVLTWHSTAPLTGATAIAAAKTALAAQQKLVREWLLIGDLSVAADLTAFRTAVEAYETAHERYVVGKAGLRDRLPYAAMSTNMDARMTGNPSLTFAEVGATGDTITRSAGSWIADGFVAGDHVTVTGSVLNNISDAKVTNVTALVLTLDTTDLADEGPVADCTVVGCAGVTFAEIGATGDTITRNRGSWLADGFRVGDNFTVSGTASNDCTTAAGIVSVTATVITLDTDDLTAEEIGCAEFTLIAGETDSECIAALDSAFSSIDNAPRIDLGYGRIAMLCPVTGWKFRRSVQWRDCIESFVRDIRTTTWWKARGSLSNADLLDADGQPYEHDERANGGALAAKFTCARTWGNGPAGTFIAQSLTRATDGSILGMTHNMHVANLAQTVCQMTTENFAGQTLLLEPADEQGKRVATSASLKELKSKVDGELARYLLSNIGGEGQRASAAEWNPAMDDDLGIAQAVLNGTLALELNGTLVTIATKVKVK